MQDTKQLKLEFTEALTAAVEECKAFGYYPARFILLLHYNDPVFLAQKLVGSGELQSGLRNLAKRERLDLAVESLMLRPRFQPLFGKAFLAAARWRLEQAQAGAEMLALGQ